MAGLMMFGNGLAVREVFDNIFMDYRDESHKTDDVRWNDRITYDGTWENNLFNFLGKVMPKLTAELPKPFKLKGYTRSDDTPLHKAVREACVNMVIHADYMLTGTLKVIKAADGFEVTNPGVLKIPKEQIYHGGNSKARNPRIESMLRMVGYGDNVESGFPTILNAWKEQRWKTPELIEDTILNQVTLILKMLPDEAGVMKEDENFNQKKERSLKEVLSVKEYERLLPIIEYLEDNQEIKTDTAEQLTGKSAATAWRYLKKLVEVGVLEPDGNTNNAGYKRV
ncbi:MAG: ATP-binding protein [Lachnospiraceae bacterium]|nr:ATP-binding protein [Lachnospiraceae bacterium]